MTCICQSVKRMEQMATRVDPTWSAQLGRVEYQVHDRGHFDSFFKFDWEFNFSDWTCSDSSIWLKVSAIKIMICVTTMAPVTNWWRCEIAQFQFIWLVTQSEILQIRIWISIWINAFVIRVDWALKLTYSAFHFLRLLYFNRWVTRAYGA